VRAQDGLAEVVEHLTARLKAGEAVDQDACLAAHPEHAAEVRRLLPALQLLADLSRSPGAVLSCPAPAAPEAAEVLGQLGDFRLLREVGRGGMGVVYEAEQLSLNRRVALKVLPFAAALDARQLQRFKNEAHAAAHLQHQHIVPVYYVGVERGVHFYSMQFIDGQTLAQLIHELRRQAGATTAGDRAEHRAPDPEQTTPYQADAAPPAAASTATVHNLPAYAETPPPSPPPWSSGRGRDFFRAAARLGAQVAEALEHAHQLGVVHRDIKPGNLMVDGRGELWVTDFGLAQVQGDAKLTLTGDLVGTLRYMSPEQALAQRVVVDHRTDVYSLGATLYELLTLEPAFGGTDRQELLRQIAFEEPRPPRRLNKAVPAELDTVVLKAMAKDPAERYATAQELADDLERFLKDEPIRARRPTLVQRARKWTRRHKAATRGAVAIALVCLLGGAGVWYQRHSRLETARQTAQASLSQARALAVDDQLGPARQELAKAKGTLAEERSALAGLADEIEALDEEIARYVDFLERSDRIDEAILPRGRAEALSGRGHGRVAHPPALGSEGSEQPEQVAGLGRRALSHYGVLDRDDWSDALDHSRLTPEQVGRIRHIAYQVLLWLANDAVTRRRDYQTGRPVSTESAARLALTYLRQAELARPPTRVFYWQRARCRRLLKDEDGARSDERRLRETPATIALDHRLLGGQAFAADDRRTAGKEFEAALRIAPADFWSFVWLGAALLDVGGNEERAQAVRIFTGCIISRPNRAALYRLRAVAYGKLDRHADALADYSTAIRLDPTIAEIWTFRGNVYRALGRLREARADQEEALRLRPGYAEGHMGLGHVFYEQRQLGRAVAEYETAIRLKPDLVQAHASLVRALLRQGRTDLAVATYHRKARLLERFTDAHLLIGGALYNDGKFHEAEMAFRHALRFPSREEGEVAHYDLGNALAKQNKLREAIAEYREALRLNPRYADAYVNLADALWKQGNLPEAEAVCREGIRLRQADVKGHYNLGHYLAGQDRFAEAAAEYRTVLRYQPDSAEAHCNLGGVLMKMGEFAEALRERRRGHQLGSRRPDWRYPSGEWVGECGRVANLDAQRPALLRGEVRPTVAADWVMLAWIYAQRYRRLYAASASLYTQVFAAFPKKTADPGGWNVYNAACAAVLAGTGQGRDAGGLTAAERTRWRKQAIDWLRTDLAAFARRLQAGRPGDRRVVRDEMEHWLHDDDLSAIRDAAGIARLPADEQRACLKLWAAVDELLGRARGPDRQ
jgi:serine/threonine protein kinase/Tfp pilus assembly protein PilF